MMPKLRMFFWIALPFATVLFLLWAQSPQIPETSLDRAELAPKMSALPESQNVQCQLWLPDGTPAAQAGGVLLDPELAPLSISKAGLATGKVSKTGHFRILAWHDGCKLLTAGPMAKFPDSGLAFELAPEPPTPLEALAEARDVAVRLFSETDANKCTPEETSMAGTLLLFHRATAPEEAPWVCVLDDSAQGVALNLPREPLRVSIYAPGMPPTPSWLISELSLDPAEDELRLSLGAQKLRLHDLDQGAVYELVRLPDSAHDAPAAYPLIRVQEAGALALPPLPPTGTWKITGPNGFEQEFEAHAGNLDLHCTKATDATLLLKSKNGTSP